MRKDAAELEQLRLAGGHRPGPRAGGRVAAARTHGGGGRGGHRRRDRRGRPRHSRFRHRRLRANGASPHHAVSDRIIEVGDVVVVDIGGPLSSGYNSDSTRTYAVGSPPADRRRAVYGVLQSAQAAAVHAVRPGVTCQDVDGPRGRSWPTRGAGHFIHRTGHGIGLDVHEEPYIVEGNDLPLEVGMTFSIEPGVYLGGRWGARIEDIVAVTHDGVARLNHRPHELGIL